jgi:Ni,Fe-hydrogenase III large subunit
MNYIEIDKNPGKVKMNEIPVLEYPVFLTEMDDLLKDVSNHCLTYFAYPLSDRINFICCIGCDVSGSIRIFSHEQVKKERIVIESLTRKHFQFHLFEREIHENTGIDFEGHPWLKPVRYSFDRADKGHVMNNYPFYSIIGEELHEVGVGPIHAGIIEPGYFRFICNGEKVLHLEIQLGYQHRGLERLMVSKKSILQKSILAESIAGDTVIGHSICHAGLMETMAGIHVPDQLQLERMIALEMERIAVHIGDTAALCTDIAYQFGQVVNEALRTIVINSMQLWCGNRFGKGLIRPGGSHYPLYPETIKKILDNLKETEERYLQMTARLFSMPSVLSRFEAIGKVTTAQVSMIGAVGMAARSSGLKRDIRWSHPFGGGKGHPYNPVILHICDVLSRVILRKMEVEKSIDIIRQLIGLIQNHQGTVPVMKPDYNVSLDPDTFAISLVEGWRGEICHTAITDENGNHIHYKIKDPSFHNWMALALAVRGQEISDFPLCNKSYNLSYCGHDL